MALLNVYGIRASAPGSRRASSRSTSMPEKCRWSRSRRSRACRARARSVKVCAGSRSISTSSVSEKLPIASAIRGWIGGRLATVVASVNRRPAPHRASVCA